MTAELPTKGHLLLEAWHVLYDRQYDAGSGGAGPVRRESLRRDWQQLVEHLGKLETKAEQTLDRAEDIIQVFQDATNPEGCGTNVSASIPHAATDAVEALHAGDFLGDEPITLVDKRLCAYPSLYIELAESLEDRLEPGESDIAAECLGRIADLDMQRRRWLAGAKPSLEMFRHCAGALGSCAVSGRGRVC